MSFWKEYKLGDFVTSNNQSIDKNYPYETIQYLDTGSITRGKIDMFQLLLISEIPSRAKRLVKENDIIYSTVRPIQRHYGYIKTPPDNLVVSTGFSVLEIDTTKAEPLFIYYYLTSDNIVEELDVIADASTSTYPSLKPSDIENLDILLPPPTEQKAIASVLSSLDDKIDLLHRQNKTLEAMAETLFRQWFIEEAQDDWEEGQLIDLMVLQRGFDLPTQNRISGLYPIYAASGFSGYHEESKVKGPGVTTGRSGLLGKVFFILDNFWPLNTSLFVKEFKIATPLFSYLCLKNLDLESFNAGSAVPTLNRNHLHEHSITIPPKYLIEEYEHIMMQNFNKIKANQIQIKTLEKLRDTLLPKLMSGEVRVEH